MDAVYYLVDLVLHLDKHLSLIIEEYGLWTYSILFLIVFCETGLVVTPILPGDSLLFAVGSFAASGSLELSVVIPLLTIAAILGDAVNYAFGAYLGPKVFSRFLKQEYLDRTHRFYEKYGAKTIVLARFVPIVRTFAPFVAGVGRMSYAKFATYNVVGGIVWVVLFTVAGFAFGNIPIVRNNFTLVMLGIVFVSILPAIIEYWRARKSPEPQVPTGAA